MNMKKLMTLAGLCVVPTLGWGQLVTTSSSDATALVNDILSGFSLVGTPTLVGQTGQQGFFSGGGSAGITINSGIVLSSGLAANAIGPNNSPNTTQAWGTAGDAQLNALTTGTGYDANTLTFSFNAPAAGTLHFNYVFGSEEYNEYVGSQFDDVFGFFLDGNNVALLPSTTTPVSINTVNNGLNSADYIDNSAIWDANHSATPPYGPYNTQMDGFTIPLTVSADLTAGEHTIKLGVEDVSDDLYDSWVFIQGGSFSTNTTPTTPDGGSTLGLISLALTGLLGLKRKL